MKYSIAHALLAHELIPIYQFVTSYSCITSIDRERPGYDQLTTESAKEGEARLHRMSMRQHERLATESSNEAIPNEHASARSAQVCIIVCHLLTYYLLLVRALKLRVAHYRSCTSYTLGRKKKIGDMERTLAIIFYIGTQNGM